MSYGSSSMGSSSYGGGISFTAAVVANIKKHIISAYMRITGG